MDSDSTPASAALPTDSPPAGGDGLPNGGFPEPPPGAPVRVVRAEHAACGTSTRVRLPAPLPPSAVRRVICQGCARAYEAPRVEELELLQPSLRGSVRDPRSRGFRIASLAVGAAAVIGAVALIQGSSSDEEPSSSSPAAEDAGTAGGDAGGRNARERGPADLVRQSSFSLALPPGWQRTNPSGGATFAASAPGGEADVTLWIDRDPDLTFAEFEAQSLANLRSLAGSAQVVNRQTGPSADDTIVTLAADAPPDSPNYEVTLRASGPHRYYLATTVQPDAGSATTDGVDLIQGSFVPTGADS